MVKYSVVAFSISHLLLLQKCNETAMTEHISHVYKSFQSKAFVRWSGGYILIVYYLFHIMHFFFSDDCTELWFAARHSNIQFWYSLLSGSSVFPVQSLFTWPDHGLLLGGINWRGKLVVNYGSLTTISLIFSTACYSLPPKWYLFVSSIFVHLSLSTFGGGCVCAMHVWVFFLKSD